MEACIYCGAKVRRTLSASDGIRELTYCNNIFLNGEIYDVRDRTCYERQLAQQAELLRQSLEALQTADKLFLRCQRWTKTEAQIMVPVQKLRLDLEAWGRDYALLDEHLIV